MATNNSKQQLHIAMFPWLAFGHITPFLELAKLIALKGHKVSFISAPKNIDRLPQLPPNLLPNLKLIKLPLPTVESLPKDAEATSDLPYDKVQYLKISYDGMKDSMYGFLKAESPDWVVYDFVAHWVGPIAADLKISSAFFSIFTGAFMGFMGRGTSRSGDGSNPENLTVPPKWVNFPTTVAFRLYEVMRMIDSFTGNESAASDVERLVGSSQDCDVILVRSCADFEPEWLKLIEELHKKPVIPVGQLPTTTNDDDDEDNEKNHTWKAMKGWLDKQEKKSVVYIAFGSEAKPTQEELNEIALGLELSNLPFFWVIKKQRGVSDTDVIELPEGFEERTRGRGLVCTSWAPQLKVLGHESVGGFLTHSGWSSVVEAIQEEIPLILLPLLADQGLNARLLEEKKMGYAIPRDKRTGWFTRGDVAESLKLVVVEEEGRVYRDKVKEMRGLFGDRGKQMRYVDKLLDYFQSQRQKGVKI